MARISGKELKLYDRQRAKLYKFIKNNTWTAERSPKLMLSRQVESFVGKLLRETIKELVDK